MKIYRYKNVIISSLSTQVSQAVLICHGGYTPSSNIIFRGSGFIMVPHNLTIGFNCKEDHVSVGPRVLHFLNGHAYIPQDIYYGGSYIKNYSITHDSKYATLQPKAEIDIITISPSGKAHISDVFNAIKVLKKEYIFLYSFACRVNKSTFRGEIEVIR